MNTYKKTALECVNKARRALDNSPPEFDQAIATCCEGISVIEYHPDQLILGILYWIRGRALAQQYESTSKLQGLAQGINDLEIALSLHDDSSTANDVRSDLATAQTRLGEQYGDLSLLQEATKHFELVKLGRVNSRLNIEERMGEAVAKFRIGSITGDRSAVIESCENLQKLILEHKDNDILRRKIVINLATALLENARQNRSERVYREVIATLNCKLGNLQPDTTLLQTRGSAKQELSELSGDPSLADSAILDFNLALSLNNSSAISRVELLHSLAQSNFRLGRLHRDPAALTRSIAFIDDAIALLSQKNIGDDARFARLFAARAAYRFALAVIAREPDILNYAVQDYENALALIQAERGPALYATIAQGLFILRARRREWTQALAVFSDLENTWELVLFDSSLSHSTYAQRAADMAGQYARAALCCLALGDAAKAALYVERGRAQTLVATTSSQMTHDSNIPAHSDLNYAVNTWQKSRIESDTKACRKAWERLLDVRRRHGMNMNATLPDTDKLFCLLPPMVVVVQIVSIDGEVFLIAFDRGGVIGHSRKRNAHASISALLNATKDDVSDWATEYSYFHESDNVDGNTIFHRWSDCINNAHTVLGRELMQPISALLYKSISPIDNVKVLVSPPGEIISLPLLTATLEDGVAFNIRWQATLAPSVSLLSMNDRPRKTQTLTKGSVLIVSAPNNNWSEGELPGAEREAARLEQLIPTTISTHLKGENATLSQVLEAFEKAQMVHFATHGQYSDKNPTESGLHLSHGQSLSTYQLMSIHRRQQRLKLVVFSACETAIAGRSFPNDEYVGLLPSALQSGAELVIGSLWAVYDDSARIFIERFYQILISDSGSWKTTPIEALRNAQGWLQRVTLRELIDCGYLAQYEAEALMQNRFDVTRLRQIRNITRMNSANNKLAQNDLNSKPFGSPADWAAFVVMGC